MNPITKISQTDAAVEQIKGFLLSDAIDAGDKLPTEKKFCESLRVGRSTVREALRVLQVMGYVRIHPGRGAYLAAKQLDDAAPATATWFDSNRLRIQDVVEVRLALETLAVKLAAERASQDEIEDIDKRRLAFEAALREGDYEKLPGLDEEFHQSLVNAAKNDLLTGINRLAAAAFKEFRKKSFRIREHAANAVVPHRDIAAALRLRDSGLARTLLRRHLEKILVDRDSVVKKHESARFRAGPEEMPRPRTNAS